jgi:hypothetical protein
MTENFSKGLKLIDLDDFLTPSQECVKPVKIIKKESKLAEIQIDLKGKKKIFIKKKEIIFKLMKMVKKQN